MSGQGKLHRLTALRVAKLRKPGFYNDGGGLNLQITERGAKSWIFRYRIGKGRRDMGLGSASDVGLADARTAAARCRRRRERGEDPIEVREAERARAALDAARTMTFDQCAAAYIAAHETGWKNRKHKTQWRNTLATYVSPVFGGLSVQSIDTGIVMKVVEPLWTAKPATASRVRGRIEAVLDWARARGYRDAESSNPARMRGHIDYLLPKRSAVHKTVHHRAMLYGEMPVFMAELRQQEGNAARALEFAILTGARTTEVLLATWDEFDLAGKLWTVPAHRMKMKREHRIPLSEPTLAVIRSMMAVAEGDLVFPGARRGRPMSSMAMLWVLDRMGRRDATTVHGFRAVLKTWATERTNFAREVVEAALAHTSGDKVEAAYQRGDLFDKRRRLMLAWADYITKPPAKGNVVAMGAAKAGGWP